MRSVFFVLSLFASFLLIGQSDFGKLANQQSVREEMSAIGSGKMVNGYGFNNDYKGILGSPFLFDHWQGGVLVLASDPSKIHTNIQMKFDIYNNELWLLYKKDSSILYSKDVLSFSLGNNENPFREFNIPDGSRKFCQVIYSDTTFILIKEAKKLLIKSNYVNKGMYSTGEKYDRFKEDVQYFISKAKGSYKPFDMKKGSFENLTPKNGNRDLKSFMKREKFGNKLNETQAISVLLFLAES